MADIYFIYIVTNYWIDVCNISNRNISSSINYNWHFHYNYCSNSSYWRHHGRRRNSNSMYPDCNSLRSTWRLDYLQSSNVRNHYANRSWSNACNTWCSEYCISIQFQELWPLTLVACILRWYYKCDLRINLCILRIWSTSGISNYHGYNDDSRFNHNYCCYN